MAELPQCDTYWKLTHGVMFVTTLMGLLAKLITEFVWSGLVLPLFSSCPAESHAPKSFLEPRGIAAFAAPGHDFADFDAQTEFR